ncbi:MAG: hypothetical protein V4550_21480 [Gemmatimonadota bacterium]
MKVLITARLTLVLIAVIVWGYGQRADLPELRMAGMAIMVGALLLRFAPKRWFGVEEQ